MCTHWLWCIVMHTAPLQHALQNTLTLGHSNTHCDTAARKPEHSASLQQHFYIHWPWGIATHSASLQHVLQHTLTLRHCNTHCNTATRTAAHTDSEALRHALWLCNTHCNTHWLWGTATHIATLQHALTLRHCNKWCTRTQHCATYSAESCHTLECVTSHA